MNLKDNEKQYYDKIVELYNKYGDNIPDADLMHLSVIEKELGISFQRSQKLFELVKNKIQSDSEIHSTSIKNESKIEKIETIDTTVIENKPIEETSTADVEILVKDSESQHKENPTQPVNAPKSMLETENKDLIPVEDPGDINNWKVNKKYTIGFITIIFWGIGLIIMIWETIAVIRHKNKQLRYAKYLVQRDKIKQ